MVDEREIDTGDEKEMESDDFMHAYMYRPNTRTIFNFKATNTKKENEVKTFSFWH